MSLPCDSPPISGSGPRANLLVLHPTPLNPSIPNYFRLLTQPRCGIAAPLALRLRFWHTRGRLGWCVFGCHATYSGSDTQTTSRENVAKSQNISNPGTLAYAVWSIRKRLGPRATQKNLASRLGLLSHATVSKWESGSRTPDRPILRRLLDLAIEPHEVEPIRAALGTVQIGEFTVVASEEPVRDPDEQAARLREQMQADAASVLATASTLEMATLRNVLLLFRKGGFWSRALAELIHAAHFGRDAHITPRVLRFIEQAGPSDRAQLEALLGGAQVGPIPDDRLRKYLYQMADSLSGGEEEYRAELQPTVEAIEREILEEEEIRKQASSPADQQEKAIIEAALKLHRMRHESSIAESILNIVHQAAKAPQS